MQLLLVTLFSLLLVGALAAWYRAVYRKRPPVHDNTPSYLRRESLLLEHEQHYFRSLTQVVENYARVFPKVRLSDLVQPHGVQPEQKAHWMRVQRRCVDFLLCSPDNLAPVLAIDLDTRAKKRRRAQSPGGDVLDLALKRANIPLLRVRATREYDQYEVMRQIRLALATSEEPVHEMFGEHGRRRGSWPGVLEAHIPTLSRWTSGLWGVLRRA